MKNKIQQRLQQLRTEYQNGQTMLQELQQKQSNLEQTLLRITGAIQVLEELSPEATAQPSAAQADGESQ